MVALFDVRVLFLCLNASPTFGIVVSLTAACTYIPSNSRVDHIVLFEVA
jgi:hypothetical protein